MTLRAIAAWLGVAGSALQLVGSVLTLWSLLAAARTVLQRARALVGALWRSPKSRVAAALSDLNKEDRSRVLQGVAVFALGYLLALASQIWLILLGP
jgi:hypothetical protein